MKHINIPVFIPHLGCPNACVFCNQRTISGTVEFDESKVAYIIDEALSTADNAECEIAFFGGSFTGIDRGLMVRLLETAESYVARGKVTGIRMSTRPDYIDHGIIEILRRYTITQVELGIQSMSDRVLALSKRGHTASDTERACALLSDAGYEVVGQMMIGLPGASLEDETNTAKRICEMNCAAARIYPTIVFKDTELDLMNSMGSYIPLTVDEAAERSAAVLGILDENGVKCLRIGLCDSENLHSESTYSAGPAHPALGEIVMSRVFLKRIIDCINKQSYSFNDLSGRELVVECPKGAISKVVGNGKENERRLAREFGIKRLKTIEKDDLLGYNIKVLFI